MSSLAEEFFKRIMAGQPTPAEFLKSLVNSTPPTFETEWRDFKGKPANDDDLRKHWSRSLSAFSNTEGGVLIWGIDARKDPATGIDAAIGLKLIPNTSQHKSRLLQLLHEATDPPTQGVLIEEISDPASGGAGFVICLIPESDQKPVQAELVENSPFYMRAGESSVRINRSLLRSLFYPQTTAIIEIDAGCTWHGPQQTAAVEVRIRNVGTGTARELFIVFSRILKTSDLAAGHSSNPEWESGNNPAGISMTCQIPLHPAQVSKLLYDSYRFGRLPYERLPESTSIGYEFLVYGLSSKAQQFILYFDRTAIENSAHIRATRVP